MTTDPYRSWLENRRNVARSSELTNRIMQRVAEIDDQRQSQWWPRLARRIELSRPARWAVYSGALVVGSLPFVFLAHVAKFVTI